MMHESTDIHSKFQGAVLDQESRLQAVSPELKANESLWHDTLNRLPQGIGILDASNGKTVWINSSLMALLSEGIGTSHVLGLNPAEYLPGLNSEEWEDAVNTSAHLDAPNSTPAARRLQFVHFASRNISYWEWSVVPIEQKRISRYLLLSVQVVSDQVLNERILASAGRTAERARKRAEALFSLTQLVNASLTTPDLLRAITNQAASFFESSHAAVLLLKPDGSTLEIGYAIGLKMTGTYADCTMNLSNTLAGRAISQRQTQVISYLDDDHLITPLLNNGEAPIALISSPIWQDGRNYGVVEVYFSEPRDIPDNAQTMLSAFADQTAIALHKADLYEQLAVQRRQLQSIVENAPVSIIYFDTRGTVLTVNQAAARKYDIAMDAMIGHFYQEFLTDVPAGLFENVLEGVPFHASHLVHNSPSEGQIVCDLTLRPVRDGTGKVAGVLLLSFEVTELVKARQEADAARLSAERTLEQLQATQTQMVQMEKMRAIGELASGVAHDFNNALMAILGYAELAEESLDSPEQLKEQLGIIRQAAADASATVRRLQKFAKQRGVTNGDPTDINAIVKDVVVMTRHLWKDAAQKEGRIYDVQMDLHPVALIDAEPSGLREVLVNMILNALNAMPEGGRLQLSTRTRGPDEVEIVVEDSGCGMTPEVSARIFDPFFTTRGVEGTGLGLAVSWTIIQRHGGTIEVDSAVGRGTRFTLRFPIGDGKLTTEPQLQTQRAAVPRSSGIRALVVDDEPFVASVLTTILTRHGYRVTAVHSAPDALIQLYEDKDDPYSFVLTDHGMPDMTGLQLIAELKQKRPDLPVLLLTGWGESLLQTHVAESLPDAILGKPINQADLLDSIGRVLREKDVPLLS